MDYLYLNWAFFQLANQADKAQERNLKRVQVRSSPFSPPFTDRIRPPRRSRSIEIVRIQTARDYGTDKVSTVRYGMHL